MTMSFREQKHEEEETVDGKNFELEELAEILALVEKYNLSDFEVERGGDRLKLSRGANQKDSRNGEYSPQYSGLHYQGHQYQGSQYQGGQPTYHLTPPQIIPFVREEGSLSGQTQNTQPNVGQPSQQVPQLSLSKPQKDITSPMVGTFYRRPAVDAEPYVNVGDVVKKGDVLCIIEAMKLMNEIESEVSGKIVEVCLEDGQMAEYGEVLFRVEPS